MASLVRRLTNSTSLRAHLFPKPKPKPFPIPYHNHLDPPKSDTQVTHLGPVSIGKAESLLPVFPCFPFGFFLNPVLQIGSGRVGVCEGDTMWADSVKKKRKRKMNKHKLRKLRKSLRRKT